MKVWLLYENSESNPNNVYMNKNDVIKDLNLDIIFKFMARNDNFIYKTVRSVMLNCLTEQKAVIYRQEILQDCINQYEDIFKLYEMATKTMIEIENFMESTKKSSSNNVSKSMYVLQNLEILGILVTGLEEVKAFLDKVEGNFKSRGLRTFYERLISDYNYEFVLKIKNSLNEMSFLTEGGEITFSASIGQGLKCSNIFINHLTKEEFKKRKKKKLVTILFYKLFKKNTFLLEDDRIAHDAREMEAAGLAHIVKYYQNFIRELTSFFENLRFQLAFYIGCANLKNRLDQMKIHTSFPNVLSNHTHTLSFTKLFELSMAIFIRHMPVTNDLESEDTKLFIITGANQGGKSTYLRSIGIAQIMMQCGMFVPAESYTSGLYDAIYTHFTRREDTAMNSGKLDEELHRMSNILNDITPNSLILLNESFATTTEREGSQIALDVINALYENDTQVIMVTHLFEFTKAMYEKRLNSVKFLSAERLDDGTRTYRILEKEPERTSYGLDLYEQIINA